MFQQSAMYVMWSAPIITVRRCGPATSGRNNAATTTTTARTTFPGATSDPRLAEKTPGPEQQHRDEDREDDGIAQRGGDVEIRHRLDEADEETGHEGAAHAAESAHHGDDEGLQHELIADERADQRERDHDGPRQRGRRRPQREREQIHARDVDAD